MISSQTARNPSGSVIARIAKSRSNSSSDIYPPIRSALSSGILPSYYTTLCFHIWLPYAQLRAPHKPELFRQFARGFQPRLLLLLVGVYCSSRPVIPAGPTENEQPKDINDNIANARRPLSFVLFVFRKGHKCPFEHVSLRANSSNTQAGEVGAIRPRRSLTGQHFQCPLLSTIDSMS